MTFVTVLALLLSYVLGSIPAATWVARARGVDIRTVGSGNSGATNVLRAVGSGPALAVALFDILKGALAVWIARALGLEGPWAALCGVAAVIGHNFSPFLKFRGGKGVSTSFGTVAALDPLVGLAAFVLGVGTVWLTRFVSAGSILGGVAAAFTVLALGRPAWLCAAVVGLVALLIWQHRENVRRLSAGNERRLGEKMK
ncbi:glycerol-3-phosphate 1-O-acyltransferase PlsY [Deinococcus sp.]|uniref:glycerol-3-phosphate 1-O-acyltransferase PlsY n=1 Tax=Deinococcus sp. TaxID=47478 RepID=UPI002869A304|nr:glycerol-3-phosphate 1-O-acyltransferase PlsY [Deinococcus sp.]